MGDSCSTIRGTVIIEGTNPAQPLVDAVVRVGAVRGTRFTMLAETRTDKGGRFSFDLAVAPTRDDAAPLLEVRVYQNDERMGAHGDTRWRRSVDPGPLIICVEAASDCAVAPETLPQGFPGNNNVWGRVRHDDGTPVANVIVDVVQITWTGETTLVSVNTDANGWYAATITPPKDIQVKALEPAVAPALPRLLGTSRAHFGPTFPIRVDLDICDDKYRRATEWSRLSGALNPLLSGTAPQDLTTRKIAVLSGRTRWDVERIGLWTLAHRIGLTIPADVESIYGLLRMGFPRSKEALLSRPRSTVGPALSRAATLNLIARNKSVAPNLDSLLTALANGLKAALGGTRADTLGAILRTSTLPLTTTQINDFIGLYVDHVGTEEEFWGLVFTPPSSGLPSFNAAAKAEAMRLVTLGTLALSFAPAVASILVTIGSGPASDVATIDAAGWATIVSPARLTTLPAGLPGPDQRAVLAAYLAEHAERMFPSRTAREGLLDNLGTGHPLEAAKTFFTNNPSFDIASSRVDDATFAGDETLREATKAVQRLYRIAPEVGRASAIATLGSAGFRSAHAVAAQTRARFVAEHGGTLGVETAEEVFRKASALQAITTTFLLQAHPNNSQTSYQFVATVTDPLSNVVAAEYDYTALQPKKVTDPNGNRTEAAYDALGRIIAVAVEGKEGSSDGDTLADPTTTYTYDLACWETDQDPVNVHVRTRETHGDSGTRWYDRYTYSDGAGNVVQEKVNAEPGKAYEVVSGTLTEVDADPRWVGTGRTVFDNKGSPVKQYEPFFSTTEAYEDEKDLVEWGVTPIISYDPIGRATNVKLPNGTLRKIEFDPWSQTTWDENDSVNDTDCTASSTLKALAVGADTPTMVRLDVQGRVYATEETLEAASGSTPATTYTTTLTLDVAGNATAVTAQRENSVTEVVTDYTIETRTFDMLGRPLKVTSPDGGTKVALLDVAGQPLTVLEGSSVTRVHAYDALRREASRTVTDGAGTRVTDVFEYGEAATDPEDENLRGKPWRTWHKGGRDEFTSYDFKGNRLSWTRRYWDRAGTSSDTADWTTTDDGNLESDTDLWLTTTYTYDALNRVTSKTAPDGAVQAFTYNEAGLFETTTVDSDDFVTGVAYNARGQRESIEYGNGVTTEYTYEPETFRLATLVSVRTRMEGGVEVSATLQNLAFTYDPVGNIREIVNSADDTVFFDNVAVSPNQAFTYDAYYRLKTATGREKVSRGQPYNGDPGAGTLRDPYTAVALYEQRYTYDAVGNLTEMRHLISSATDWVRTYTYEEDGSNDPVSNRLVDTTESVGTVEYQHDDRGNIVFLPHLYNDGATPDPSPNVEYDDRGQMVRAQINSSDYALYYYDSAGQRVRKVVVTGAVVEDRRYVDGYEVWRKTSSGTLTEERTTLHVMDGEKRIAMVETKTVGTSAPLTRVRYQLGNHLGTSVLEVNEDGDVISYEEYHPYGSTAWWTNDGDTEVSQKRYRYTGKEKDEETGLYYHGARYYAPWLGRWTSRDPDPSQASYVYASNRPVKLVDKNGFKPSEYGDLSVSHLSGLTQKDVDAAKLAFIRANSERFTFGELKEMRRSIDAAAGDNLQVQYAFYAHYINKGVKPAQQGDLNPGVFAETKGGGSGTTVDRSYFSGNFDFKAAGLPGYDSRTGGTLLLHELGHVQDPPGTALYLSRREGRAYGIEFFFSERVGDKARSDFIVNTVYWPATKDAKVDIGGAAGQQDFRRAYGTLKILQLVSEGKGAEWASLAELPSSVASLKPEEARALMAQFIAAPVEEWDPRLQEAVNWTNNNEMYLIGRAQLGDAPRSGQ